MPRPGAAQADLWPGTGVWAQAVLDTLSLEAKVSQLFVTDARGTAEGTSPQEMERLLDRVGSFGAGGVLFFSGDAERQAALTRTLQDAATLPLLVAQDMENGVGMRVEGTTAFPPMMALGATGDPELAYALGEHIAAEARALGVHVNFAPVADVNNNPLNPIINTRSFGEDPQAVSEFAVAAFRGMQDAGLIATAKHFPGHGDTDTDSHHALPLLDFPRARLDTTELVPFRAAIDAGVRMVMTAHLAIPTLEPDPTLPATLSPRVITDLLRGELGFEGLVVTDGLDMGGITDGFGIGESAVRALEAGVDLLLLTRDEYVARAAVMEALRDGRIPEHRIDASVLRVLRAKEALGLTNSPQTPDTPINVLLEPGDALAKAIARRSVTVLRNDRTLLPFREGTCLLVLSMESWNAPQGQPFVNRLRRLAGAEHVAHRVLRRDAAQAEADRLFGLAERHDVIVVPVYQSVRSWSRRGLPDVQRDLVNRLAAFGKAVVLVAFGNPYLPLDLDRTQAEVVVYDAHERTQRAVADALMGHSRTSGRLPVSVPGVYRRGDGLTQTAAVPSVDSVALRQIDAVVREAIGERVFPGAVVGVGVGDRVVKMQGYGRATYDRDAAPVTPASVFDLASLTKAVGTTLAAMKLYDEGRLDLDAPAARYVPAFGQNGKDGVTVRQLLSHSAGQRVFHPFHTEGFSDREAVLDFVYADTLRYAPGTATRYSDFDMIVLGAVVEAITGQPLDVYLHATFYEPLGMTDTGFRSVGTVDPQALPTEVDRTFRGRALQGEVHDETASLLGGVAGHAGLFSTAPDLARLARLLTNGGEAYGRRFFSAATVGAFTARARPVGEFPAALGWAAWRPLAEGYSSGGTRLGPRAFGHTGFTGTSLWIDPDTGLWVVLLTNRTWPERSASRIGAVRARVADLAVEAVHGEAVNRETVNRNLRPQ
ncbi:MAG: glycoside hydrolase family 3 N-terminal domain-containing protein [Bacteroidota bacterium]